MFLGEGNPNPQTALIIGKHWPQGYILVNIVALIGLPVALAILDRDLAWTELLPEPIRMESGETALDYKNRTTGRRQEVETVQATLRHLACLANAADIRPGVAQ
jgi:hypothetical protein